MVIMEHPSINGWFGGTPMTSETIWLWKNLNFDPSTALRHSKGSHHSRASEAQHRGSSQDRRWRRLSAAEAEQRSRFSATGGGAYLESHHVRGWYRTGEMHETWMNLAISGTEWLEVPTVYKAYFLGLCKGISLQNKALYGTVRPF